MSSDYFALPNIQVQSEIVPELVAQRGALTYIVGSSELSSLFFLTEDELSAGLRRSTSRKGKGKERQAPQSHHPIVLLLSLLDRSSILKTPSLMESLVALLALVTRPLVSLQDSTDKEESEKAASSSAAVTSGNTEEPRPSTEAQPTPAAPAADAQSAAAQPSEPATNQASGSNAADKVLLSQPPAIPHHVLKYVVNILTTGECFGRAFSHTLALIQHLSHISEAKEVIAQELRPRAQEFGQRLYESLDELAGALQEKREEDVTTAIASKFSPASSDQAKLLRILKTIDYVYSPKQTSTTSTSTPDQADVEKLQNIYESFKIAALWRRLGDCLAIIDENS
ncbi:hypothetical protein K474DRAFT_315871 [Panus rudis PR-1116 ss-1]|nr:hypothetical protein K474DRAFT_315871 [Panus rudis PR-1116 ss-1]